MKVIAASRFDTQGQRYGDTNFDISKFVSYDDFSNTYVIQLKEKLNVKELSDNIRNILEKEKIKTIDDGFYHCHENPKNSSNKFYHRLYKNKEEEETKEEKEEMLTGTAYEKSKVNFYLTKIKRILEKGTAGQKIEPVSYLTIVSEERESNYFAVIFDDYKNKGWNCKTSFLRNFFNSDKRNLEKILKRNEL